MVYELITYYYPSKQAETFKSFIGKNYYRDKSFIKTLTQGNDKNIVIKLEDNQKIKEFPDTPLFRTLKDFYENEKENLTNYAYEMRIVGRLVQYIHKGNYVDQEVKCSEKDAAVDFVISNKKLPLTTTLTDSIIKDLKLEICEVKLSQNTRKDTIAKDIQKLIDVYNELKGKHKIHCYFIFIELQEKPGIAVFEIKPSEKL